MLTALSLVCLLAQRPPEDLPLLRVGETIEGEIADADPQVHTPTLDKSYTDAPAVARSFVIEVEAPGPYTLELRSYLFDAYLVLRDGDGKVLAEDDDGAVGIHARMTAELEARALYLVDASALHGERGTFELELRRGGPAALSPDEERKAERLDLERTAETRERILGPAHPSTATSLDNLARLLQAEGDYAAARPLYERALAIREKSLGLENPDAAQSLDNLAILLGYYQGDYSAARLLLERALASYEKHFGPEHPAAARTLILLGDLLRTQGDYAAARPLLERALAIYEKLLGPEHADTASALDSLATLLQAQGDYAAARLLYERALAIEERVLGPEHPDTATSLNNLAGLIKEQGDYVAARPLYERALAIYEKVLGPEHPYNAASLSNLADLLGKQGDYSAARPLNERALAIYEKALGPEHPDTATSLNNLAHLLGMQGDYAAARPLNERVLAICEKVLGPEHPLTATSLDNLGNLLWDQGDYSAARPLLERALAIREKVLGPKHPDIAGSLSSLAGLLQNQGDYAAARLLKERALAICEEVLGPEHPNTATSLDNLANLLWGQGDYAAARSFHERALALCEKILGPEHPDTAISRYSLATLLTDGGFESEALDFARGALTSRLAHAESTLWSLSELERLLFLRQGERYLRLVLSLARRAEPPGRGAAAYELQLALRGLSSRTLLESRSRLQAKAPEGAGAVIGNLHGVQSQLSKLLYATEIPDPERHEREIRDLRERRNDLEVELQRLVGPSAEHAVTLAELRESLEPASAFLDFLVHPLYEPAERQGEKLIRKGRWTSNHLSAWIVRPEELVHLDLGPAAEIEAAVKGWLGELVLRRGISAETEASESGAKLRALLWQPLANALEGVARVFVRPDSFLGTLPFGVIPLEKGRYLIEEKDFVYVQTPNDLVQKKERSSSAPASLLAVGGVDFKKRAELEEKTSAGAPIAAVASMSDELRGSLNHFWSRLPHTENEAQTVSDLFEAAFPGGEPLFLSGDLPSEERLKQELPRHAVAHLATHGFFNPEGTVSMWDSAQEAVQKEEHGRLAGLETETRALVGALPGLLTGLVCAGANEPAPAGRDDGLLTAEEVLWLDLSKVDLVVLSACETALGERRSGEGMIGLRRAFGLAGAKTVVSSLWSVKDRSTSELMQRFYENLWLKKQGRADALRNAQLEMLAKNRATEGDALPSTWGAFVLSGEWR